MALGTPRTGTRPSSDGPRCTVNRDATSPGGLSGAEMQVRGQLDELCDVFSPDSPPTTAWDILLKQSPRSAQSKLDYSEKWQRTTPPVDHEVAGAWDMAGMWWGRVIRLASAWEGGGRSAFCGWGGDWEIRFALPPHLRTRSRDPHR